MKPQHDIIEDEIRPSLKEIGGWALALQQLHHRIAPRFARPEPRRHALLYLQGILSEIPQKIAGKWPNMPDKRDRMACNACSQGRSGM